MLLLEQRTMVSFSDFCPTIIWDKSQLKAPKIEKSEKIKAQLLHQLLKLTLQRCLCFFSYFTRLYQKLRFVWKTVFGQKSSKTVTVWRTWLSQLHFSAAAVLTVQSLKQLKVVLSGNSLKTELKLKNWLLYVVPVCAQLCAVTVLTDCLWLLNYSSCHNLTNFFLLSNWLSISKIFLSIVNRFVNNVSQTLQQDVYGAPATFGPPVKWNKWIQW